MKPQPPPHEEAATPYIVYGLNPALGLLTDEARGIDSVVIQKGLHSARLNEAVEHARRRGIKFRFAERRELDQLAEGGLHQGIVVRVLPRRGIAWEDLLARAAARKAFLLLILDGVKDPHNLGAALRSAEAFGADGVVLPKDRTAPLSGTAVKASAGAAEKIDLVRVTNLARAITELQEVGVFVVGLDGEAVIPLGEADLKGRLALVVGEEGSGLRRLTRERCDRLAAIPMTGATQSLNLSVAAAVALYEAVRQRGE